MGENGVLIFDGARQHASMDDMKQRLCDDLASAFPELVRCFQHDLYSGLRRMNSHADAEDLIQETFIRAYRALEKYPSARILDLRLRGWIWTIALNLGRNFARDRSRRPTPVELFDRHGSDDPDPVDFDMWNRLLGTLSDRQRRAVVLRHVVGLNYHELADALGTPAGTAKSDVSRGLAKLRLVIEEQA
ncbi:MAG: sigma-70 family RNA polymerase sigma factor [Acidimicrobiia bacterium]|nr:sigma-70 family RNA polymerase sigma factor [Acidimicrobiia bacterium]